MDANIFIPKKCKVGFNTRQDTYTGKLGYIIYNDGKVWRKEPSWEGWREKYISQEEFDTAKLTAFTKEVERQTEYYNQYLLSEVPPQGKYDAYNQCRGKSLEEYLALRNCANLNTYRFYMGKVSTDITINPIEFDNEPLEGFVLNKKAGGYSSGWNHRQTYCRVYDPRGFEFEISIPNLLYILENSNSIKGKGLEGKFMYGWEGKDLVLLPENSPEFQKNLAYTDMQDIKLKKADLVLGGVYLCKDNVERTYMGESEYYGYEGLSEGRKLWFWEPNKYYINRFLTYPIDKPKVFLRTDEEYAAKAELLTKEKCYIKPELEYKEVDLQTLKAGQPTFSHWYGNKHYFYVQAGKKYKRAVVTLHRDWSSYNHTVSIGRQEYNYKTLTEILTNHKLWQVTKMTKES